MSLAPAPDGSEAATVEDAALVRWAADAEPLPLVRAALDADPGAHLAVWGLWGPARAMALAAAAGERPMCVVTPTSVDAERAGGVLESIYGEHQVAVLPAREYLSGGDALPVEEGIGERLSILKTLLSDPRSVRAIVIPIHALMQTVATPHWLREHAIHIAKGTEIAPDDLAMALLKIGFERVHHVERPGEMSLRGGIFDIFPQCEPGGPVRLEFFGDEIDSIRQFDVGSQISLLHRDELTVMPRSRAVELPAETGAETGSIIDFLPEDMMFCWWEPQNIEAEHDRLTSGDVLSTEQGPWHRLNVCVDAMRERTSLAVSQTGAEPDCIPVDTEWAAHTSGLARFARDLDSLWPSIRGWMDRGNRVVLFANREGEAERLEEVSRDHGLAPVRVGAVDADIDFQICLGRFAASVEWPDAKTVILSQQELYGRAPRRRLRRRFQTGTPIEHYSDLRVGDYVVHTEHGIGAYRGLVYLPESQADFLLLEYQDNDKLYVPIDQIDLVQKYVGGGETPTVHKLGGTLWKKTKAKVQRAIQEIAGELVTLYAARQTRPGHVFGADADWQREFEDAFEHEPTADQSAAIEAVAADMHGTTPMDRLLCGDVGYGKTEVALRAAFRAVMGGKQVAVLAPTTVLAQQHFATFSERMAQFPVRIALLSRLRSQSEIRDTVGRIAAGDVDIAIGTHRLVQSDVTFKDLGLVIIDEEQRFGVTHKERLKQLRTQVDVLAMSATPIPRTLHMSLMGVRDLSLISTPPVGRLPIITTVERYDPDLIRDAIRRELAREGQVYFVHNRVQSIQGFAQEVQSLVPEARIGVGHGQMKPRELEDVMLRFLHREFDILISTTIIENGLDMPNVNTILIDRADRFGLSQLYQLRGRVGRFTHRAYAYLLLPEQQRVTETAQQRLDAIREFANLGAGLSLALRDLEIRGAGNLLGAEQSGEIAAVGFDLYCQLIGDAVKELQGEKEQELVLPRVELGIPAFIPDEYVISPMQKLGLYKRLSLLRDLEAVAGFAAELADRYGPLPDPLVHLLRVTETRILGARAGLEFVGRSGREVVIRFPPSGELSVGALEAMSQRYGALLRAELTVPMKLFLPITADTEDKLVPLVRRIVGDISEVVSADSSN